MIVGEFFDVHTAYFIKNSYRGTGLLETKVVKKTFLSLSYSIFSIYNALPSRAG